MDSSILDVACNERNDQFIGRIQTYLLRSLDGAKYEVTRKRLDALCTKSRWHAYNMSRYHHENNHGPYLVRGEIDWVQIEALSNVIWMNLMELCGIWVDSCPPVGLEAARVYSVIDTTHCTTADWACVEGTWRRIVCFMDYQFVLLASYQILN